MRGVHQGALLRLFVLENKSVFIVAGTCASNVRSLKEIHAWADLELPFSEIFTLLL